MKIGIIIALALLMIISIIGSGFIGCTGTGEYIDEGKRESYETELENIQMAVKAILIESTEVRLDRAVATTDDMTTVTVDNGAKSLDEYMTNLNADGTLKMGCTYAFTVDGEVTQTTP